MDTYEYEYTDTFSGEANYSWVRRGSVMVPELTHYGFDGLFHYAKANRRQMIQVVRKVKAALSASGIPCRREWIGDTLALYPRGSCTVVFINYREANDTRPSP